MSPLLVRILLGIIMIPSAVLVYALATFEMEQAGIATFFVFVWAGVVTALFIVLYWLSLWRSSVRWTPSRKWLTLVAGPASIVVGGGVGLAFALLQRYFEGELVAVVGSVASILVWLALTLFIWRETAAERLETLAQSRGELLCCPKCGYNMVGLHEARCPECGVQFTLDQLYLAQARPRLADAFGNCETAAE